MQTANSRYEELRPILHDVDDATIKRVVATGASVTEVTEALGYIKSHENGEALVEDVSSPRVLEVRAILAEVHPHDNVDN